MGFSIKGTTTKITQVATTIHGAKAGAGKPIKVEAKAKKASK